MPGGVIFADWTISLNHPTAGAYAATNVLAANFIFDTKKESAQQFFRTFIDQPIIFQGPDYDYLKAIEDGGDRCEEITMTITNPVFSVTYRLPLVGTEFDADLKQVIIEPIPDDAYQCVLDNWEDPISIFTTPSTTVELYQGVIESETVNFSAHVDINNPPGPSSDPTDPAWQQLSLDASFALSTWAGTVVWVRQTVTTTCSGGLPVAPAGSGWLLRVDDCGGSNTATYSKPVPLLRDPEEEYIATSTRRRIYNLVPGYDLATDTVLEIDNGRRLMVVLQNWYAGTCSANVVTDLFTYNAPGTNPTNAVYDQKINVAELVIFQRSDVKRPGAFQNATQGNIKPKDILEGLWATFRAHWWIDSSGDLRIEHESTLDDSSAFDFATSNPEELRGTNNYKSLQDGLPRNQVFSWDEAYSQRDFEGDPLNYPNACANDEETFTAPWTTDVNSILTNPDVASDGGFVLMATIEDGGDYYLPTEGGAITGDELLNGHLAWANLQEVYHQHRRPFLSGIMNTASHTFTSVAPFKQQEISIIYSLADFYNFLQAVEDQETDSGITTGLGVGEVESARYDVKNQTLTIRSKQV